MIIGAEECAKIRQHSDGASSNSIIAERIDTSEIIVEYHAQGKCNHETSASSAEPTQVQDLPEKQCTQIRELVSKDTNPRDIVEKTGENWSVVIAHLTGECDHEPGPTFARQSIYERILLSPEECAHLRREYDETQKIKALAENLPWGYTTILKHLNGKCDHDIPIEPRETQDRTHVSVELCQQIRETYRNNSNYLIETIADQYEVTASTAERHLKFRCSHSPSKSLQELINSAGLESHTNIEAESNGSETEIVSSEASSQSAETPVENQSTGDASISSPVEIDTSTIPTPRLTIVGELEQVDKAAVTRRLEDLGWRVGSTPQSEDQFCVVADTSTSGGDDRTKNVSAPVIDEPTFLEYFGWNDEDSEGTSASETITEHGGENGQSPTSGRDADTQDTRIKKGSDEAVDLFLSDQEHLDGDAETYRISLQAKAAVRQAVTDPNVDKTTESDLLSSIVRTHLKETVDSPDPDVTDVPAPSAPVTVTIEPHNRVLIESLCGDIGNYEAPSAFIEDAVRSKLDVSEATVEDVTIPADTVAKITVVNELGNKDVTIEEFVRNAVEQTLDERLSGG